MWIIFFLLLVPISYAAIEEYEIVDQYGNEGIGAKSYNREEMEEFAKKHNGGMVFKDVDTGEYSFVSSECNMDGLIYWYNED